MKQIIKHFEASSLIELEMQITNSAQRRNMRVVSLSTEYRAKYKNAYFAVVVFESWGKGNENA